MQEKFKSPKRLKPVLSPSKTFVTFARISGYLIEILFRDQNLMTRRRFIEHDVIDIEDDRRKIPAIKGGLFSAFY